MLWIHYLAQPTKICENPTILNKYTQPNVIMQLKDIDQPKGINVFFLYKLIDRDITCLIKDFCRF